MNLEYAILNHTHNGENSSILDDYANIDNSLIEVTESVYLDKDKHILANMASGDIYLPSEPYEGDTVYIVKTNAGAGTIEVQSGSTSQTLTPDDIASIDLVSQYDAIALTLINSVWLRTSGVGGTDYQSLYPVGSVYINASVNTDPATLLGFGTWTALGTGRVLIGQDTGDSKFNTMGETGGAETINIRHMHYTSMGFDGNRFYGRADSSYHPNYGSRVITDNVVHVNKTGGGSVGGLREAETSDSLSTSQSIMNPYVVVKMWYRSA